MSAPSNRPDLKDVNYDALLEDVLGLNIRALKSLWGSFRAPTNYFKAANHANWKNQFTPAFRLWFTLIAITFFFQFFWAGGSSATLQMAMSQIEAGGTLPEGVTARMAATEYLRWSFGFLPFILAGSLFLLAAIFPFWGEKVNFAVRQRRLFIAVIPGTFVAIFSTIALGLSPLKYMVPLLVVTYGASFIFDSGTAYRGAFKKHSISGKLWRSLALGLATLLTSLAAGLLSNIAAMVAIAIKYN